VIKTFPSDRAEQPLRISILPRRNGKLRPLGELRADQFLHQHDVDFSDLRLRENTGMNRSATVALTGCRPLLAKNPTDLGKDR
jgi:hypothetical protein